MFLQLVLRSFIGKPLFTSFIMKKNSRVKDLEGDDEYWNCVKVAVLFTPPVDPALQSKKEGRKPVANLVLEHL